MAYVYNPISGKDNDVPYGNDNDTRVMTEGLLGLPTSVPTVAGQTMMQVTAPATLPEGYELPVQLGSQQFKVKVPLGGIEEGQVFTVPVPTETLKAAGDASNRAASSIPVGAWRDGECDCCNYGACHPHIWTSLLCPLLAAGQVINRLQFTWYGKAAQTAAESARAFLIIFYITVAHWILFAILEISVMILMPDPYDAYAYDVDTAEYDSPFSDSTSQYHPLPDSFQPTGLLAVIINVYTILKWVYIAIIFVVLLSLRISVRNKFGIGGNFLKDCCCTYWFPCLVAGQMLRHTTDYDVYPSQLCSTTGLSEKSIGPMTV